MKRDARNKTKAYIHEYTLYKSIKVVFDQILEESKYEYQFINNPKRLLMSIIKIKIVGLRFPGFMKYLRARIKSRLQRQL